MPPAGIWDRLPVSRGHAVLFCLVAAFYLAVIVAVLTTSRLVALDWKVMLWAPYQRLPKLNDFLNLYVVTGQRPLRDRRDRLAGLALLAHPQLAAPADPGGGLGAAQHDRGRGQDLHRTARTPLRTRLRVQRAVHGRRHISSGHTANAVVTWGVLAYLAIRGRRAGAVLAGWMGFSVGVTTVYLGTHWVSDVLAGWASGLLVLLALPLFEPIVSTMDDRLQALVTRRRGDAPTLSPIPAPRNRELQESPR
ncbi:phosphatase PAP2 family protein [Streptacidiphilus monticola]